MFQNELPQDHMMAKSIKCFSSNSSKLKVIPSVIENESSFSKRYFSMSMIEYAEEDEIIPILIVLSDFEFSSLKIDSLKAMRDRALR